MVVAILVKQMMSIYGMNNHLRETLTRYPFCGTYLIMATSSLVREAPMESSILRDIFR